MSEQSASQVSSKKGDLVNNGTRKTTAAKRYDSHATQLKFPFPDPDPETSSDQGGAAQGQGGKP